ncbi:MAG: hypothetical protein AB2693_15880, partial [Candidatus Thiodiazotropha sp.]
FHQNPLKTVRGVEETRSVTDTGRTDGMTDGRKDGRTDEPITIVPFDYVGGQSGEVKATKGDG